MLDAFFKGVLIFFAMIGVVEFAYIIYSICASRTLRSDVWIVVRPQENEQIEDVIRGLKACIDETLVKQAQANLIILSEEQQYDELCESCRTFASVTRCSKEQLNSVMELTKKPER